MRRRKLVLRSVLVLTSLLLILYVPPVSGHETKAYYYGKDDEGFDYSNPDWMAPLPDDLRISELSIPGTHETMARFGGQPAQCNGLTLRTQLDAGIRALDIRCRHIGGTCTEHRICGPFRLCPYPCDACEYGDRDVFTIHHGEVYQEATFGTDVLDPVREFLSEHPGETVLMRISETHWPECTRGAFADTFVRYMNYWAYWVYGWDSPQSKFTGKRNPTLGEVRGKIVVLDSFSEEFPCEDQPKEDCKEYGLPYPTGPTEQWPSNSLFMIQDVYNITWGYLLQKWDGIAEYLEQASTRPVDELDNIFVNYLSGSGMYLPCSVASGHTTCGNDGDHPPGYGGKGMNNNAWSWIREKNDEKWQGRLRLVGIIMADYPGEHLIEAIINLNPWTLPPVADAGGPYQGDEGAQITFDGSGSTDPDGDALKYRWDFDGDGTWDPGWSGSPTASHTWHDDWIGEATLEVTDGRFADQDAAPVTVNNVAPVVTAEGSTIDENGWATVSGTITDPGTLDTFTVTIDWGEGSDTYNYPAGTTTYSQQHQYLDDNPSGTPSDVYPVTVTVEDDDGGIGTANTSVTVNNVAPAVSLDSIQDELGAEIPGDVPVALVHLGIEVAGSFSDVGTQDTHTAVMDWGDGTTHDLGPVSGTTVDSYAYPSPGDYEIKLTVTDDDTGASLAAAPITVVDAARAVEVVVDLLLPHDGDSNVTDAIDKLRGEDGGEADNGALDMMAKGNLNAAMEKILQAEQALETVDLPYIKSLLALAAKSGALQLIGQAEAAASKKNELRKIEEAKELMEQADACLADHDFVGAVHKCQAACRELAGIQ